MVDILFIIVFVVIDKFCLGSTVLDRRLRIIGRMMVIMRSLELLMMVFVQYRLLLSANSIALLLAFHYIMLLIMVLILVATITISLQYCTHLYCCSSSEEYEGDNYEHEMRYHYYDLVVAMNNNRMSKTAAAA